LVLQPGTVLLSHFSTATPAAGLFSFSKACFKKQARPVSKLFQKAGLICFKKPVAQTFGDGVYPILHPITMPEAGLFPSSTLVSESRLFETDIL